MCWWLVVLGVLFVWFVCVVWWIFVLLGFVALLEFGEGHLQELHLQHLLGGEFL